MSNITDAWEAKCQRWVDYSKTLETRLAEANAKLEKLQGKTGCCILCEGYAREIEEQARLLGKSGSREADLLAKIAKLESCHPPCDGPEAATCRVCDRVAKLEAVRVPAEKINNDIQNGEGIGYQNQLDLDEAIDALKEAK